MIYKSIYEMIGDTPLLKLRRFNPYPNVDLYAKLELWNPGGSVKDRIGIAMLKGALERGLIHEETVLIEATAGNTGIGLALAAQSMGLRLILVVPEKFSLEKQQVMRALGAEIVLTPRENGMKGAMARAEELLSQVEHAVSLKQFENPDNIKAHYEGTGPEIYADIGASITHFVAGAGSGGTFTGVARYLKEKIPNLKAYVAEPDGSTMGGGKACTYEIEGIGNDFIPKTMDMLLVDHFIKVTDEQAFNAVRSFALKEGILCGSSSGAALHAALEIASTLESGTIVVVLPDRGDRYFSKNLF